MTVKKLVSETDKKFNTIDRFINVAAFTERGTILSTTEENYDKNFNVNVKAPSFYDARCYKNNDKR